MDHYYIQCEDKDIPMALEALKASKLQIDENHIYIDSIETLDSWNTMMQTISTHDRLFVSDISELSVDTHEFKSKLKDLMNKSVELYDLESQKYYVDQLLKAVEFTLNKGLYKQKRKQRQGIEKALLEKKNGTGDYGRPRIFLPADFEENIKLVLAKQMSHETYRAKIGMKKSTYFKVVKELRDSWKTSN